MPAIFGARIATLPLPLAPWHTVQYSKPLWAPRAGSALIDNNATAVETAIDRIDMEVSRRALGRRRGRILALAQVDIGQGVERRIHRPLLPAWQVAHLIANDVVIAGRCLQQLVPLVAQLDRPGGRTAEHVVHAYPGDADTAFDVVAEARVQLLGLPDRQLQPLLVRQAREPLSGLLTERIGAQHHALLAVDAMRRIPDLLDVLRSPGDTAIDVLPLPESFLHLKADLEQLAARYRRQPGGVFGRKVVLDAAHQVHRNTVQAVVRVDHAARPIHTVDDTNAALLQLHRLHLRVQAYVVPNLSQETRGHPIHAADRLHHGRGLVVHFPEAHQIHEIRLQQLVNIERLLQHI